MFHRLLCQQNPTENRTTITPNSIRASAHMRATWNTPRLGSPQLTSCRISPSACKLLIALEGGGCNLHSHRPSSRVTSRTPCLRLFSVHTNLMLARSLLFTTKICPTKHGIGQIGGYSLALGETVASCGRMWRAAPVPAVRHNCLYSLAVTNHANHRCIAFMFSVNRPVSASLCWQ